MSSNSKMSFSNFIKSGKQFSDKRTSIANIIEKCNKKIFSDKPYLQHQPYGWP